MKDYDYYFFDFDGTVCDTTEGIINSVIHSLDVFGIREYDIKSLDYFIGPPLFESYKHLFGVTDDEANELIRIYRERYAVTAAEESKLYEDVTVMLDALKSRGKKTALATSKPGVFIEKICRYHGISDSFDFISAATFADKHSDKESLITACLEHFNVTDRSRAIMIGDRYMDIDGGKACGLDTAGALYGFGDEKELSEAGATYLLNSPLELLNT